MLRKIIKVVSFAVLGLGIIGYYFLINQKPKLEGDVYGLPIGQSTTAYFDRYGIPHIDAETEEDAFMVLGYIMAQDRLFQMDLYRRMVRGTLSEVLGDKTVKADTLLRRLRLKKRAEEILESTRPSIAPKTFKLMESFLTGVQTYIDNNPLPLEFQLLGYKPEVFEISDMLGMSGYMALTFAEGLIGDVLLSDLEDLLPTNKFELIQSMDHADKKYFKNSQRLFPVVEEVVLNGLEQLKNVLPLFHGSNSWVLSGERTRSGFPILANDPHIAVSFPHIFYEAHIKAGDFELYGNYIPLIPFAIMGHTPYSGWAITMAEVDDLNIYEEKVNFEEKKVMFKGEWVDLIEEKEVIKVKGKEDIEISVFQTPHGPLLNGTKYGREGKNLSLYWAVFDKENNVLSTFYDLPRAQTLEEFKDAVSKATSPALNLSWAHKDGDIAWWVMGKYAKLPKPFIGNSVLPGWDGSADIEGFYSFEENPHEVNPDSGVIVTANYKPWDKKFDHFYGYWQPGGRFHRLHKLLSKQEKWSLEELKLIQTDDTLPTIDLMKKSYLTYINKNELNIYQRKALQAFIKWDGAHSTESVGASIYNKWTQVLIKSIFEDELGKYNFTSFAKTAEYWHAFRKVLVKPDQPFWDNVKTPKVESMSEIMTASFKQTVSNLKRTLGYDISKWKWGRLHQIHFNHPLGKQRPLNLIFNESDIAIRGGRYLINNLGHDKTKDGFDVVHAPATRRLIDFQNPRKSFGVIPSGNSGNPFSKHYFDQNKLYKNNKYRDQLMFWEDISRERALNFISADK